MSDDESIFEKIIDWLGEDERRERAKEREGQRQREAAREAKKAREAAKKWKAGRDSRIVEKARRDAVYEFAKRKALEELAAAEKRGKKPAPAPVKKQTKRNPKKMKRNAGCA